MSSQCVCTVRLSPVLTDGLQERNPNRTSDKVLGSTDLVGSSLYQFDDKPEHYHARQSLYNNVTQSLSLTALEELDLMTKWLSRESSNHVRRIRSVHVRNPDIALKKVWERLKKCYAAPEIIEKSLYQRLDNFPKFSKKENAKIRELADLLMQVQCAKEDGTSRGIEPLVVKLPYGLQEKWISAGSKYKDENGSQFPPSNYFARNDPSFTIPSVTSPPSRFGIAFSSLSPISANKADVTSTDLFANCPTNASSDSSKSCPIHCKPHPLNQCKTFRDKNLEDRTTSLKERGISFKCCSSTTHFAKDCPKVVRCIK